MTTKLIIPATEYTNLDEVKAAAAAEVEEAAYMESMGFVVEEETVDAGRTIGFLAAAYRAAGIDMSPARARVTI